MHTQVLAADDVGGGPAGAATVAEYPAVRPAAGTPGTAAMLDTQATGGWDRSMSRLVNPQGAVS